MFVHGQISSPQLFQDDLASIDTWDFFVIAAKKIPQTPEDFKFRKGRGNRSPQNVPHPSSPVPPRAIGFLFYSSRADGPGKNAG
jgi:hypothetical protein